MNDYILLIPAARLTFFEEYFQIIAVSFLLASPLSGLINSYILLLSTHPNSLDRLP